MQSLYSNACQKLKYYITCYLYSKMKSFDLYWNTLWVGFEYLWLCSKTCDLHSKSIIYIRNPQFCYLIKKTCYLYSEILWFVTENLVIYIRKSCYLIRKLMICVLKSYNLYSKSCDVSQCYWGILIKLCVLGFLCLNLYGDPKFAPKHPWMSAH